MSPFFHFGHPDLNKSNRMPESSSTATMDTVTKHGVSKMGQPGSNRTERPNLTDRMKQSVAMVTAVTKQSQNAKNNGPNQEHGLTSKSNQQEEPNPSNSAVAQPAKNGRHDDADTENKQETDRTSEVSMENDTDLKTDQATKQKNEDDSEDEATSDSSRSTDDIPNNGSLKK